MPKATMPKLEKRVPQPFTVEECRFQPKTDPLSGDCVIDVRGAD